MISIILQAQANNWSFPVMMVSHVRYPLFLYDQAATEKAKDQKKFAEEIKKVTMW